MQLRHVTIEYMTSHYFEDRDKNAVQPGPSVVVIAVCNADRSLLVGGVVDDMRDRKLRLDRQMRRWVFISERRKLADRRGMIWRVVRSGRGMPRHVGEVEGPAEGEWLYGGTDRGRTSDTTRSLALSLNPRCRSRSARCRAGRSALSGRGSLARRNGLPRCAGRIGCTPRLRGETRFMSCGLAVVPVVQTGMELCLGEIRPRMVAHHREQLVGKLEALDRLPSLGGGRPNLVCSGEERLVCVKPD